MSTGKRNMEDFLRNKLDQLENRFQDDWDVFEQKLERALFFKRLRIGAALSVFLIATSIGIFGTSSIVTFDGDSEEAPFGSFTDEGFESIGSQSSWDTQNISYTDETAPVELSPISSESAESAPAYPESISEASAESSSEHIATASVTEQSTVAELSSAAITLEEAVETIASSAVEQAAAAEEEQEHSIATQTVVAVSTENIPDPVQTQAAASPITSNAVDPDASNIELAIEELAQAGTELIAMAEVEEEPAEELAAPSITPEEEAYIAQKTLELNLPGIADLNTADNALGLQVRMPAPSFRVTMNKPKTPYISPLQNKSAWEYSLIVYPNFTFRKFRVDENKENFLHRDFVDQVQSSESGAFSFNIGLQVSRRLGKGSTYLKSGLEYISYNHSANFDFTNFRSANIDDQTGAIESYSLLQEPNQVTFNDKNSYHYLNIPLSISYQPWATKHIRLNMEAGASYMYFMGARGKSLDYRTLEIIDLSEREFKNSLGSITLKVGATYYVAKGINLGFEPTFVYFTNTIYTDEYPFEVIPYSVGMNFKMQVKLN